MNRVETSSSSQSNTVTGVVEKTEKELLALIPQRLLEEWDSYSLKSPRTRLDYLKHQYALSLEETHALATADSLSSVASRSVLATMAAPPAVDTWVTYIGAIASDLAWINPEFAPFMIAGVDTTLTLYEMVFGNKAQTADLAKALDNIAKEITSIKDAIAKLDHKIELAILNSWVSDITAGASTIHDFKNSVIGITDRKQLVDEMRDKFLMLPENLRKIEVVCTKIAINEDLIAGAPYPASDFPRVMAKLHLLISACVVRLGMLNLEMKREMIIYPNNNQMHQMRYKDFHDCTGKCQALLKSAVSSIVSRMKASCQQQKTTTADHIFIHIPVDKSRLDVHKKPTMGVVKYDKTVFATYPMVGSTKYPTEEYRVTAKACMPLGSKSVDIAIDVPYPCVKVTDCLESPASPPTIFYYDDDVSNNNQYGVDHIKHAFSEKEAVIANVLAEIVVRVNGSIHLKEQELNNLLVNTINKFTATINSWSEKDKNHNPVVPYKPVVPSNPLHPPTYDEFTVKPENPKIANTIWKLKQVSVLYGIQYINAIGEVSKLVWGPGVACEGRGGAPKLTNILPPTVSLEPNKPPTEDTQVAGIRIWRKFMQLGQEVGGDTLVNVLKREKSHANKFPTEYIDNFPAPVPAPAKK